MERVIIAGVPIDNVSFQEALKRIDQSIHQKKYISVVTPNVDHIMKFQKDSEFRTIYQQAALVLADGMPLLWAAKFLGTPLKEKISGSDLFPRVCGLAAQKGWRLFFLGGREGAAVQAAEILKKKYPAIEIVGVYSPPLGFEQSEKENAKIISLIQQSRPDILFVGLGAPKQEKWIHRHQEQSQVPVSIGIGVTFEFTAGMVKRAPLWMQRSGLEWFWRLLMEPGRLWKRYLIEDMQFFWLILRQKLSGARREFPRS